MLARIAATAELVPVQDAHRVWSMSEFVVRGGPTSKNPYDPDLLALDAVFTGPSGREIRLPAFWHQNYTRELKGKEEVLTKAEEGTWRVRWTPVGAGLTATGWQRCVARTCR